MGEQRPAETSAIREFMGRKYGAWRQDGGQARFANQELEHASRDDLLAVIGCLGHEKQAVRQMHDQINRMWEVLVGASK